MFPCTVKVHSLSVKGCNSHYISNSFNIYDLLMNDIFKFQFSLHLEMIITEANSL